MASWFGGLCGGGNKEIFKDFLREMSKVSEL
jgi:hypothetical protein